MDMASLLLEVFRYSPVVAVLAAMVWVQHKNNRANQKTNQELSARQIAIQDEHAKNMLGVQKEFTSKLFELQQEHHAMAEEMRDEAEVKIDEIRKEYDSLLKAAMSEFSDRLLRGQMEVAASVSRSIDKMENLTTEVRKLKQTVTELRSVVPQR